MADIKITIPNEILPRVIDAVAGENDYDNNKLEDETKGQFAKRMVIMYLKTTVKNYERDQATETARVQAEQDVENDIVLS